ncbi:Spy/CpxP family protein refolding chaperone [Pseudomonas sp. 21LCFQ02]|uniref:Spy/CpxP family protein refolding chaperone n=1 Tax=unclassified Pseudomonas TaxID=196821 RepID=UPI0004F82F11|nr:MULTISPECIES: Spy/CpxP family protein refolding chaperone [unclassified Pseudomonas]MCO8164415.1 Spy/CpxP family protein refolding chaperone [Pseudomonas sp. 21LCFQ010]MCO8169306.1 Spy/CpxP family protein refolding chaperone [Pseudomonas sp. 21LCFQ02]MCQ9424031.1 Spy/CpxP family protein refolding chaperone [Pseudomonas sp. LJDD11]BAP40892.1 Spy-related protein [Pseudomonas sp. StFLB209]
MRKTLTALMFAAALPTVAMAAPVAPADGHDGGPRFHQDHGPGKHRGGPFGDLDLSREQRQQIGKLMGEQAHARKEINERFLAKLPAADQKAMKDELEASRTKTDTAIRGLLTPEQQKEFDADKKKREERRAEWAEFQAWKAEKAKKAQ